MKKVLLLFAGIFMMTFCGKAENNTVPASKSMVDLENVELISNFGLHTPDDVEIPGWVQGLVVYDGYAVIFHAGGQVVIYKIDNKKYISSFYLPENTSHCNNAALGLKKYNTDSVFPVIYVSDCVDKGDCYVYDLNFESATEIQRIKLEEKPAGENGGNGWFIDEKDNRLGMHWNDLYYFFEIPDVNEPEAMISVKNTLTETGRMSLPKTHQGTCAWNGYIFFANGSSIEPYVTVVNIATGEHQDISLAGYGVASEPEGICEYNGSIYMSCGKSAREALLYKLDFTFNR